MNDIYIASITVFKLNQEVDFEKNIEYYKYLKTLSPKGVVLFGTTGEGSFISNNDKLKLTKYALEILTNTDIFIGINEKNIKNILSILNTYNNINIKGYMISPPSYIKPNQYGIYNFYNKISLRSKKNIMIYNIPSRTGVNINLDTIKKLSCLKNINYIKECNIDIERVKYIKNNTNMKLLLGDDFELDLIIKYKLGLVSASANALYNYINEYLSQKNVSKKIFNYIKFVYLEPNPILIKLYINEILNISVGETIFPIEISEIKKSYYIEELKQLSL